MGGQEAERKKQREESSGAESQSDGETMMVNRGPVRKHEDRDPGRQAGLKGM